MNSKLLLTNVAFSSRVVREGDTSFASGSVLAEPLPEGWITGQLGGVCIDFQ